MVDVKDRNSSGRVDSSIAMELINFKWVNRRTKWPSIAQICDVQLRYQDQWLVSEPAHLRHQKA